MPQDKEKLKKKAQKLLDNGGNLELTKLEAIMDIPDRLDEVIKSVREIPRIEIPPNKETDLTETNRLLTEMTEELKKKELTEEITYSISPAEQAKLKGDKGDNYILTGKDKQEIAKAIEVPIVEVIRETPIITNEIKEVAVYKRLEIVKEINTGEKNSLKIELQQIEKGLITKKELDFAIGVLDQRTQFLINKVSNLQIEVDNAEVSVGAIGGVITNATQGSVLFTGVGGILSQDNANLFYDDTNNALGLGISSSLAAKLDIAESIGRYALRVSKSSSSFDAVYFSNSGTGMTTLDVVSTGTTNPISILARTTNATGRPLVLRGAAAQTGNLLEWQNSTPTTLGVINSVGNFGINTTAPLAKLHIVGTSSISTAVFTGVGLNNATAGGTYTDSPTSQTYTVIIDALGTPDTFKWKRGSGSFTNGVAITGASQALANGVTITFATTTGHTVNDQWVITGTGTDILKLFNSRGTYTARFENSGGLIINNEVGTNDWHMTIQSGGVDRISWNASSMFLPNGGGINAAATVSGSGNFTMSTANNMQFSNSSTSGGSLQFLATGYNGMPLSFHVDTDAHRISYATTNGYFFGSTTTVATARVHIGAGTTAASTAPLKFTSGALNTTAEAGAVEFLTDAWYGTITTGAARKTFAFLESPTFTGTLTSTGTITAGTSSAFQWSTRSQLNSPSDGVIWLSNQAANDFTRLQFGGTTSSFPAIKRTTTALNIRLADDSGNAQLTIGKDGIAASTTDGFVIANDTAATSGVAVQMSPRLRFRGNVWNTTVTAANNTDDWWIEAIPVSGASNGANCPMRFVHSTNGGAAVTAMSISENGLTFNGAVLAGANQYFAMSARSYISAPAIAQINLQTQAGTVGIGLDFATDAVLKIRTRAQTGDASLTALTLKATQAAGYISSDGSTGATGTFTTADAKTVTVKDGIITSIV